MVVWLNVSFSLYALVVFLAPVGGISLAWTWIRRRRERRAVMLDQAVKSLSEANKDLAKYVEQVTVPEDVVPEFEQKRRVLQDLLTSIQEFVLRAKEGKKQSFYVWLWGEVNLWGSLWTLRRFTNTHLRKFAQEVTELNREWMEAVRAKLRAAQKQALDQVSDPETRYRALAPEFAFLLSMLPQELTRLAMADECVRDIPGPLSVKQQILIYQDVAKTTQKFQVMLQQGSAKGNDTQPSRHAAATKLRWFYH